MRVSNFLSLTAALGLAACSTSGGIGAALDDRQNAGPCPTVGALYDAGRIVKFADDTESYRDITYTGEIIGVRLLCRYVDDNPIIANVQVGFAFGKGPKATEDTHTYNYYVAVTRRNRRVLARETFTVEADFGRDQVDGATTAIEEIIIPRNDDSISGGNFEVLIGFELTDKQLQFNHDGKRFRLDAGG